MALFERFPMTVLLYGYIEEGRTADIALKKKEFSLFTLKLDSFYLFKKKSYRESIVFQQI